MHENTNHPPFPEPEFWHFRRAKPVARGAKTLIMGIVNLTPDSFSGTNAAAPSSGEAVEIALGMIRDGADIIDLGAESTRPGAAPVTPEEEVARLGDVVARLRERTDVPISVDTYHLGAAVHALAQGADIINDVTALRGGWDDAASANTAMAGLAAAEGAHVMLCHMPAPPAVMQDSPEYYDVFAEVREFLLERAEFAERVGVDRERIWLDPGFGFGKNFRHNQELLLRLGELADLGYPVAVGLSRKRMIADALDLAKDERVEASLALAVIAVLTGADLVRVHDVKATARAVAMTDAVRGG